MPLKKILEQLNFVGQCKKYNLSLWQCPGFLFVMIGLINISVIIAAYFIATKYVAPEIVALIVLLIALVLTTIGHFITKGFENLAHANQLKTEFVSIASHQLRTPLTGIKWTIDLMMRSRVKNIGKGDLEKLENIKESNQRMINLVNDLLSVSRIEQGRLTLKPERVSIEDVTHHLLDEYQSLAQASNTQVSIKTDTNLPMVFIDRQGLELVLRNLLDNAIRYTQGHGKVEIRILKKPRFVRCEIQDNGVGIPKKDQKKIFQKFFRSQNVLKYQTKGTGLGLFIAKGVIDNSKGKIGFKSQEGNGSTFWFELPIKS